MSPGTYIKSVEAVMSDKRTALKKGIITTLAVTLACRAVSWLNWMLFTRASFSKTCITLLLVLYLFGPVVTLESEGASPIKLTPEERSWLDANREKLILLYNIEFPPIEFKSDSGTFIGMGADVIARIEEMLGIVFIKKPSDDWNKHLAALKSGECAIAPTIVRTVEREEYAFFTAPYATVPVVIITTNAIAGRMTLNDFTGRRVGVVSGYATEKYLHDQALLGHFVVKPVGNVPEGLQSVSFGQINAYVENLAVAAYYIDKKGIPNLRVAGTTDFSFAWSIGVSRKYPLLYSSIQKALDGIPENELAKIRKKWISLEVDVGIDPETLWLLKLAALFSVLLVVSLTVITFILKYRLNQKVVDLQKSENRYRRLAENSPAVLYQFVMSPDGGFSFPYISEVVFAITGITPEEVISDSSALLNKIHPADIELFLEDIQKSADSLRPYHAAFRYHKDGQYIWLEARSTPERMPDGSILWDGFFLDITERKKSEEALQESEEKYRELVENANSIILRMDKEGRVTFFNEFAQRFFGFPEEDIIGQNVIGTIVPEKETSGRDLAPMIADIGRNPEAYATNENENMRSNGERVWIAWTNKPIYDENKQVVEILCIGNDITDRRMIEEELRRTHQRLFNIIDFLPDATFVIDNERKVIAWNKAIEIMTGIKKKDILGKGDYAYAVPFYGEPRPILIDMIFEGTEKSKNRYDMITGEGNTFFAEVYVPKTYQGKGAYLSATASPLYDSEGRTIGAIESIRDVTEYKRVERDLQESEERYRIAIESSNDGIAIMKGDEHLYVNQRFVEIFGYDDPSEIIGESNRKTVHPDDFELVNNINVRRQRGEPVPARYEFKGIKKDGTPIYLDVSATGTKYKGHFVSLVYLRDITDRKHAEDEITRERQKLKTLSDNAPFGMVLIDKDDHFTYINRKFTELFGYNLSDIPDGRTWFKKAYPDIEYRHTVISTWVEDLKDAKPGECIPRVFTVTCKDKIQRIVQFIPSVLISGDYLMTCEDITELRQLENQLRQAQKMEAIGTLAGGIAHDFNNILTALMGYAALIQIKMEITHPLRPYMDEVLSASEKAVDLTQSLLAFSRQQSVNLIPLNMNQTVKSAEKLLRRLLTEDIEFLTYLADEDMIVMADKSQMDQIFFNLVTNARDAMPKGGMLTIKTSCATVDTTFIRVHGFGEAGQYVRISITDTGMGMDEKTRSKIFDPFFTTKEVGKGTGHGLATVYGIVKQHNGYIIVESAPGQGSAFHIYLPQAKMKVDKAEERTISATRGKETILIAEDNEGVRHFMREALKGHGYTTLEAIDGEDAIGKFKQHRDIDLIIIDSVMPRKNGREAYEEIHKIDPHIKVLFTSGYTKDIVLDKGIEEKEFDFIAKPLSLHKLLQKVREVLDR